MKPLKVVGVAAATAEATMWLEAAVVVVAAAVVEVAVVVRVVVVAAAADPAAVAAFERGMEGAEAECWSGMKSPGGGGGAS